MHMTDILRQVPASIYAITYYIGQHYNGTQLYHDQKPQSGKYLLANNDSIQPNVCDWEKSKQTLVLDHNKMFIGLI